VKPASLGCLDWREEGCHELREQEVCLKSLDGRMALALNGRKVHGEPCVWCGSGRCVSGSAELCELAGPPAAEALRHSVAHCEATTTATTTTTWTSTVTTSTPTTTLTTTITATSTLTATATTTTITQTSTVTTTMTITTITTTMTTTSTTVPTTTTATVTTTMTTTLTTTEWIPPTFEPSLYCYALMLPIGYEPTLIKEQLKQAVGIFRCESYSVFSNARMQLGRWNGSGEAVTTALVKGSLKCPYGGKWNTALNTGIFIRVWTAVVTLGTFKERDWTVKVDPDAVFFPGRLRKLLKESPMDTVPLLAQKPAACGDCRLQANAGGTCSAHVKSLQQSGKDCAAALLESMRPPPGGCGCSCGAASCSEGRRFGAMFLVNCRFGLHGPIEVLSREAVTTFIENVHKCEQIQAQPFGEDKYLDQCLQLLGVRRVLQYSLLSEIACGANPSPCGTPNVAFHPFKAVQTYFDCWGYADKNGVWP